MMGSSATAMAKLIDKKINISPPRADIIDFTIDPQVISQNKDDKKIISIAFTMEIENLFSTEIV